MLSFSYNISFFFAKDITKNTSKIKSSMQTNESIMKKKQIGKINQKIKLSVLGLF